MSGVYRFHAPTDLSVSTAKMLLRKRRRSRTDEPGLMASDSSTITDAGGTRPIETYQESRTQRFYTLTRREADLIALANPGIRAPAALEDVHPWLPCKPFLNDSVATFEIIKSIVNQYGQHLVSAADYCDEKWRTICNSVRIKDGLDAHYYRAWHLPIQDVHILEERRPGRSVVAIDFNGMYAECLQYPFPKPSTLRFVRYDRQLEDAERLPCGLFRCVLDEPVSEFIHNFNPFRSFFSGRHLRTALSQPVEVDLNEFEVDYFRRHFKSIYLAGAIVSDGEVRHPLAKEARRSFARRQNFRAQGNRALADREKYLATLMSSCGSRPTRVRRTFETKNEALAWLRADYGINSPDDEPETAAEIWLQGRKGVTVVNSADGIAVDAPDLKNGSSCYLFGQRIVARGRILLLEKMERVLAVAPDVQICYTNIDSIHFSLPTRHLEQALHSLGTEASNEMGCIKIDAVTAHGLWLEPGRYWLYSDVIEKFKNRSVGDRRNPFRDHAVHVATRRIGDLHVPIRATLRMDRTMSATRSLLHDRETGLVRQRLVEINSTTEFNSVLDQLEQNQQCSTPARMAAFKRLKRSLETPASLP